MKKLIIVLVGLLALTACSVETSSFSMSSGDQEAVFEAKNADTDNAEEVTFTVYEGEITHLITNLESGVFGVAYFEGNEPVGDPIQYVEVKGNEEYDVTLPEGEYTMVVSVVEKATGTLTSRIEAAGQ